MSMFDEMLMINARADHSLYLANRDNPLIGFEEFCKEFYVELPEEDDDESDADAGHTDHTVTLEGFASGCQRAVDELKERRPVVTNPATHCGIPQQLADGECHAD